MKRVLVGGPLLGQRTPQHNGFRKTSPLESWRTFEPLVSPAIDHDDLAHLEQKNGQRFVFLTNKHYITVLSYKTGKRVAVLVPGTSDESDEDTPVTIESVCGATYPARRRTNLVTSAYQTGDQRGVFSEEYVILAGCSDGTVREFSLAELDVQTFVGDNSNLTGASYYDCGQQNEVRGPCYSPRSIYRVSGDNDLVKHLSAPSTTLTDHGVVVYAFVQTDSVKRDDCTSQETSSLYRLYLPLQNEMSTTSRANSTMDLRSLDGGWRVKGLDKVVYNTGTTESNRFLKEPAPIRLVALVGNSDRSDYKNDPSVFVVIASTSALAIYIDNQVFNSVNTLKDDQLKDEAPFEPIRIKMPKENPLSAFAVSPNGKDVACGHWDGDIRVMDNLLPLAKDYFTFNKVWKGLSEIDKASTEKVRHPSKVVLTRKLHWHAHPVTSLVYDSAMSGSDPLLYSGGEESVLAIWQLSRGLSKPIDTLPRLALDGIVHLCNVNQTTGDPAGILIFCSDNSLQIRRSIDYSLLWKVQGLAAKHSAGLIQTPYCTLAQDSRSSHGSDVSAARLIVTGLPCAPGLIQWYDPWEQNVVSSLEVSPFNRISRTEANDIPMPSPTVTHAAWSFTGDQLVTVDTVPTENASIGIVDQLPDGSSVGVVTTLRFWSKTEQSYEIVATMTSPHGSKNGTTAIALSPDGNYACTTSNDEKSFRLWRRESMPVNSQSGQQSVAWVCQYKITTPAGFSNSETKPRAVSFSSDASILAIAYGRNILLWDVQEVALVTSLHHLDDDNVPIESLSFICTGGISDLLLIQTSTGVSLRSPFGERGPLNFQWSWIVPEGSGDARVCHAQFHPANDLVSIALYYEKSQQSQIVLVRSQTGDPFTQKGEIAMPEKVSGEIVSMAAIGRPKRQQFMWDLEELPMEEPVRLYILTKEGEMIYIHNQNAVRKTPVLPSSELNRTDVPTLPLLATALGKSKKRQRSLLSLLNLDQATKKMSRINFGSVIGDSDISSALPTSELPSLRGAFARAFVGRHLQQRSEN